MLKLFKLNYKLIAIYRNGETYLIAKFTSRWQAERAMNLIIEQEKEWQHKHHYEVKQGNKVLTYR